MAAIARTSLEASFASPDEKAALLAEHAAYAAG
jgi:adenosine deaminase